MELNSLYFYVALAVLATVGILFVAFRAKVFRSRRHRERLGPTDQTVQAELNPDVHDRDPRREEIDRSAPRPGPKRPGAGNLTRFR